jgi:hypothetical protein
VVLAAAVDWWPLKATEHPESASESSTVSARISGHVPATAFLSFPSVPSSADDP